MINKLQVDMARFNLTPDEVSEFAFLTKTSIQGYVPVRSGKLRDNVLVEGTPDGSFFVGFGVDYGYYLNRGFKGFVMKQLIGKTVPIRLKDGTIIFRKATAQNVGKKQISKRDPKTGMIMTGNKPVAWRHPGVKPMRFAEKGIMAAFPTLSRMYAGIQLNKLVMIAEGMR